MWSSTICILNLLFFLELFFSHFPMNMIFFAFPMQSSCWSWSPSSSFHCIYFSRIHEICNFFLSVIIQDVPAIFHVFTLKRYHTWKIYIIPEKEKKNECVSDIKVFLLTGTVSGTKLIRPIHTVSYIIAEKSIGDTHIMATWKGIPTLLSCKRKRIKLFRGHVRTLLEFEAEIKV